MPAAKTRYQWPFWETVNFHLIFRSRIFLENRSIFNYGFVFDSLLFEKQQAYANHGDYNVFMVDWGALCRAPCYVAAVYNLKPVAKCLALSFSFLRNSGMPVQRTTCVGHSLGAHICGLMANYLDFRIERIIGKCELISITFAIIKWMSLRCVTGLDPARPLIKPGIQNRLDSGDAKSVQVMHTNAGYYGEGGRVGHVDFCVNGGKRQPYCSNTASKWSSLNVRDVKATSRLIYFSVFCVCFLDFYQIQIYVVTFGRYAICRRASTIAHWWMLSPALDAVPLVAYEIWEIIGSSSAKQLVLAFRWVNTRQWSKCFKRIPRWQNLIHFSSKFSQCIWILLFERFSGAVLSIGSGVDRWSKMLRCVPAIRSCRTRIDERSRTKSKFHRTNGWRNEIER